MTEPRIFWVETGDRYEGETSIEPSPGTMVRLKLVEADPVADLLERLLFVLPKSAEHLPLEERAAALASALRSAR